MKFMSSSAILAELLFSFDGMSQLSIESVKYGR